MLTKSVKKVKEHSKDLSEFRKETKDGKDPDVEAWDAKIGPAIEDDLKMARDLSKMKQRDEERFAPVQGGVGIGR